jgi:hypothetical protein
MERRHFLKLTFGFIAGASALAAGAVGTEAAPVPPVPPEGQGLAPRPGEGAEPAVTTQDEVDHLAPDQVRWRRHWGWRRRHWGWRRWGWRRRRHWGYRRRWHRRWRRRYWRRRYWW